MKYRWCIIHSYVNLPEGTKQLMFVSRGEIVVCCDVVRICSPWLSLSLGGKLRMARGILRYPASRQTPDIWPNLSTQTTNQGHLPVSCVAVPNAAMDLNRKTMMDHDGIFGLINPYWPPILSNSFEKNRHGLSVWVGRRSFSHCFAAQRPGRRAPARGAAGTLPCWLGATFHAEQGSGSGSEFLGPPVGTGQLVKSGKISVVSLGNHLSSWLK